MILNASTCSNRQKFTVNVLKVSDKTSYANSVDPNPDQEQSEQDLHCLPFH